MKPNYAGYEAAKAAWVRGNPEHSADSYEAVCKRLARLYGI